MAKKAKRNNRLMYAQYALIIILIATSMYGIWEMLTGWMNDLLAMFIIVAYVMTLIGVMNKAGG